MQKALESSLVAGAGLTRYARWTRIMEACTKKL
jgi:hypothetical protein